MRKSWSLAGILLVVGVFVSGCGESYEQKEAQKKAEREQTERIKRERRTQAVIEFSKAYNADTNWQKSFEGKAVWTLNLRNALVHADGRPIVAAVSIMDVDKLGDQYTFRLFASGNSIIEKQYIVFELKCAIPGFQLNTVPLDEFYVWKEPDYLVAARIRDVQIAQHLFEVKPQDSYSGLIEPLTEFIASGECLGLQRISAQAASK